jgi:hypothetical protein
MVKHFEVIAKPDDENPDTYRVKAGVGCVLLSIGWCLAALLGSIGVILRVLR